MTLAFICGCAGTALNAEERAFIRQSEPWGLILFKRNVADRAQMRALADSFRDIVGRIDAPVLIDQEGGRCSAWGRPIGRPIRARRRLARLPIMTARLPR